VRERLVFACYRAPVNLGWGAPIRTHKLLMGLSEAFDTTVVTFAHDPASPTGFRSPEELAEHFPGISVVAVPGSFATTGVAKRSSQLVSLASTRSWQFGRYIVPEFRRTLHSAVGASNAAVTHYEDLGVALSGPVPGTFNVYAAHNVEHRILAGTVESTGGVRKAFAQVEARRIRREEFDVWRRMDLCLAVSEVDAGAMYAAGARDVDISLVGIEPVSSLGLSLRSNHDALRILFVGAGNYQPNERGIAWFIENVFPYVRDTVPAVFEVVGAPPDRPIHARGVTYRGYVPSLEDYYRAAHVAVIPIFFGSGTRGKIVEAMAYGRTVVSTTLGAEGLQVEPGKHYLRADTPEEFIEVLTDLGERLRAPDPEITAMLEAGRAAAERHFYPNVVKDLVELYRSKSEMLRPGRRELP
jgi:glycosyltransferase involved in cell wall biosynthesis